MRRAALGPALLCLVSCEFLSPIEEGPEGDKREKGTAQRAGLGAIDFYRKHLSGQWGFHCDFEPSCSTYGRQAVSRYGFLAGTMMIADRLMRDHPYSRESYDTTGAGRPLDPVEDNALFAAADVDSGPLRSARPPREALSLSPSSPEALFRFAEELFSLEEWDRARVEYKRYLFHHPRGEHATRCQERIVLCLVEMGEQRRARGALEDLSPGPEQDLLRAMVLRSSGQLESAAEAAATETDEGRLLAGFLALSAGDVESAQRNFTALPDPWSDALLERCEAFEDLPGRSPTLGGFLSALLPGAGQVYSGRYADGLVAFLINGVLIGGSVAAALNDEEVAAAAIGTVGLGFYAGNIYGGANAAQRFNRNERDRFLARARGYVRQNQARLGLRPTRDGGVIAFYFGFR